MVNETLTLSIPKKLKDELRELKEVNWSEVTRQFLEERVKKMKLLKRLDELTKNSTFTEEDAVEMGRKINKAMAKRYNLQ